MIEVICGPTGERIRAFGDRFFFTDSSMTDVISADLSRRIRGALVSFYEDAAAENNPANRTLAERTVWVTAVLRIPLLPFGTRL
jgi:hypothetical protein